MQRVAELPRTLGLVDALAIVVGIVIGGGIFLVPNLVARNLSSATSILAVWIFAGVVSFFGALACAELGAALPATGGQYVFHVVDGELKRRNVTTSVSNLTRIAVTSGLSDNAMLALGALSMQSLKGGMAVRPANP